MLNLAILSTLILTPSFQSKEIGDYLPGNLRDIEFDSILGKRNVREAAKVNKDFNRQLDAANGKLQAKEPFKLRATGKVDDTTFVLVINGSMKASKISSLGLNLKSDTTANPGQRTTLLDFGILTSSIADKFYRSKFVRFDRESGNPVFDLTFPKELDYTVRMRVWIDKTKKYVIRREWYGMEGEYRASFIASNPVEVNGVTVPTKLSIFNAENQLAGEVLYKNVQINKGLADELFKI
ncbi:MAG: hypothetical protein ACOYPR_22005 [Saprospiraceae bacterium]